MIHLTARRIQAALALGLLFLAACTSSHLYLKGIDPSDDRLGLTGQVCTDDARDAGFPVKVVFLVDMAYGPVYSSFDLKAQRLTAIRDTLAIHQGNPDFSFAVVGFASTAEVLAPIEGNFTRNPGELENGVVGLAQPDGCVGGVCRDYQAGLDLARSLIEGDMASLTRGERIRTQYTVVLIAAGPPDPLVCSNECCDSDDDDCPSDCSESWSCTETVLAETVLEMRDELETDGALALSLHALLLGASDGEDSTEVALDQTENLLQELAFAGAGVLERFDIADAITFERLGLLKIASLLEIKSLLVTNRSVVPTGTGLQVDSDGDGLPDAIEEELGTDPLSKDGDEDGVSDLIESLLSLDPLVASDAPVACGELSGPPYGDADSDFLNDCEETLLGTDISLPDSDGDGLPDWIEVSLGTDYLHDDSDVDSDWDGAPNGEELLSHTDPRSSDANSHLTDAYRYEVDSDGFRTTPVVSAPTDLVGVTIIEAGEESVGGLGSLRLDLSPAPTLSWRDAQDDGPGSAQTIGEGGRLTLPSASHESAGLERWLTVEVDPDLLPPFDVEESLLVQISERQCATFTVRNIGLLETAERNGESGINDVFVYLAQAPQGRLTLPGLYRVVHVPVEYHPETGRIPDAPLVELSDDEFVLIGE